MVATVILERPERTGQIVGILTGQVRPCRGAADSDGTGTIKSGSAVTCRAICRLGLTQLGFSPFAASHLATGLGEIGSHIPYIYLVKTRRHGIHHDVFACSRFECLKRINQIVGML